jgi:hypothetical protein
MEETRRAGPSQSAAWPLLHARPNLQRLRIGTAAEAPTVAASMVARSARVPVGGAAADGGPQPCPAGWPRPRGLRLSPTGGTMATAMVATADMLVPTAGMATVPAIVPAILPTTFPDSGMATEGVESSNWDRVLRSSDRAPRFESSVQPAPEPAACRSAERRAVIGGAGMANFSTSTRRRWRDWRAGDALAISRPTGRFLYRRGARRRPCHPKIAPPGVSRSKRGRSRRSGDA